MENRKPTGRNRYLPKTGEIDYHKTRDGMRIRYGYFPAVGVKKGTVLLLNGHREFIEKYTEFIENFQERNFDVYSMDHRGQGLSDRALKDPKKSHNPSFSNLIKDIDEVVRQIICPSQLNEPFFIVAHSLGSHLALRYLHDYPEVADKAVLLSPFTDIDNRSLLYVFVIKMIFFIMNSIGFGEKFALGQAKGRSMINHEEAFSKLTHDKKRYQWSQDAIDENPELFIGGVTYGGAAETVRSLNLLKSQGYMEKIKTPILCLLSGEEKVVNNDTTVSLLGNTQNALIDTIPQARHEIYREEDHIRDQLWAKIDDFLKS